MKQVVSRVGANVEAFQYRLSTVEAQHQKLDERLRELGRRATLTPTEQREVAELKKQKLKAKDELVALKQVF
jgi:uncharacterized protein YdcH (DUF465 family)